MTQAHPQSDAPHNSRNGVNPTPQVQAEDRAAWEGMTDMPEHMRGYMDAMHGMMEGMPMETSGDPDADFLLMMIPHHQSAVDMARVELEHGDDEETRAMAEKVIEAQEAEIAEMRAMLARMGVEAPTAPAD